MTRYMETGRQEIGLVRQRFQQGHGRRPLVSEVRPYRAIGKTERQCHVDVIFRKGNTHVDECELLDELLRRFSHRADRAHYRGYVPPAPLQRHPGQQRSHLRHFRDTAGNHRA